MAGIRDAYGNLPTPTKIALVCAILGFILSFSFSSTTTVNGQVSCSSLDIAKVGFGAAAAINGVQSVLVARRQLERYNNTAALVIGLGAIALGILHLLTGFGVVGGC